MPDKSYLEAMHAVQTGVMYDIERHGLSGAAADPKHLRTGINSAIVNDAALARLLIAKGVFTEEEYAAAVTVEANREAGRYEEKLTAAYGRKINLH
jgi:hypothetical protein